MRLSGEVPDKKVQREGVIWWKMPCFPQRNAPVSTRWEQVKNLSIALREVPLQTFEL